MDHFLEEKNELSGKDFAVDIAGHALQFIRSLETNANSLFSMKDEGLQLSDSCEKYIDTFNKEVLKTVSKLPSRILGTLFHETIINKTLDPECVITIHKNKIDIYLSDKGTVQ